MFRPIVVLLAGICAASAASCAPEAKAVTPFDLKSYLGIWYQIADTAVFNNRTEKGCECVYANYTLEDASTVRVENVCYESGKKSSIVGKAKQVVPNSGALKVSFFGPFYGPYNVINLKKDARGAYGISLVYSCTEVLPDQDVWILARTRHISDSDYEEMTKYAQSRGINIDKLELIKTKQDNCPPLM